MIVNNTERKKETVTSDSGSTGDLAKTSDSSAAPMKSTDVSEKAPSYAEKAASGISRSQDQGSIQKGSSMKRRPSGGKEPDFLTP